MGNLLDESCCLQRNHTVQDLHLPKEKE